MNPLAQELNDQIRAANPNVLDMLSSLGRELYFPKGILSQSAEAKAKAKKHNATIGQAREEGHAMFLPSVMASVASLSADQALNYAPVTGLPDLRDAWMKKILHDNPSLEGVAMSKPIVTNGLTHALSLVGDLFVDPNDTILLPDKIWGNYRLTYCLRYGAKIASYPFYGENGGFNADGFRATLKDLCGKLEKVIVLLNFPNNPTGYTPTRTEAQQIADALIEAAEGGTNIVAVTDDAYFSLFYDDDASTESLFSLIAGKHERLLAVKGDAATKEVFVWGLRIGFLSFSIGGADADSPLLTALEKKVSGAIRSVVSNGCALSQQVVLKSLTAPTFYEERKAKRDILCERAVEVKRVLADPRYAEVWEPYDFNSGYFMCLRLKNINADALRVHLLDKYETGTIATAEHDLRIAFSCVEKDQIADVFETVYKAAKELAG